MRYTYNIRTRDGILLGRILAPDEAKALATLRTYPRKINTKDTLNIFFNPVLESNVELLDDENNFYIETVDPKSANKCALCGKDHKPTGKGDHVIAKAFFAPGNRNDNIVYIKVPCHAKCNEEYSMDEEYLALLFASSINCGDHPDAKGLLDPDGPVIRNWEKYRRGPIPRFLREMRSAWVYHDGMVRPSGLSQFDHVQIERYFDKVVKGLYFFHTGTNIPDNLRNYVHLHGSEIPNRSFAKAISNSVNVGNGVFRYGLLQIGDPPTKIFWLTTFYNGFHSSIFTKKERKVGNLIKLIGRIDGLTIGDYYKIIEIDDNSSEAILNPIISEASVKIRKGFLYKFEITTESS